MSKQRIVQISVVLFGLLMAALCLSAQEYSLLLNGDGQYANCGSSPDFNISNALTVEAWIYPTDFKEAEHMNTIVAKTLWSFEYSHGWTFRYGSANRSLNFNMGGGAGVNWIDCKADGVLTLNTWQHVAATYDGATIRVYVNGTQVATQAFAGGITNADEDLCIGSINNPADMRYMTGKIDEVRVWSAVRSAEEISDNVHHSVTSPYLVAYYKMDGGSGTVLTDDSGNGHTADIIGSSTWTLEPPREYSLKFLGGAGQYVDCGVDFPFSGNSNLTLEAWIYPIYSVYYYQNPIVSKNKITGTSINGWYFTYDTSSKSLTFTIDPDNSSVIYCNANNVLILDKWQHVAATYDHNAIRLYVNGVLVATTNCSIPLPTDDANLFIGRARFPSWNRLATGYIDDVRIWKCRRYAIQIADSRFQSVSDPDLMACYQMSNGAGTRLTDNSGNGRLGTLYSWPTWITQSPHNTTFISTKPTSAISSTSATANGWIDHIGYPIPITYGHCWSNTITEPNLDSCNRTSQGPVANTGAYISVLVGLTPQTHYWVRVYATYLDGSLPVTTYGNVTDFYTTATPPPTPLAQPASSITSSGFTANWIGYDWYNYSPYGTSWYNFSIDVSMDSDFNSYLDGYNNRVCGGHDNTSPTTHYSLQLTGLATGTTYYYRIRSVSASYSPYSSTIAVTTLSNYNVSFNTGNITGVRIFTAETDYGIDPPSPLVLTEGYTGTIQAEKDGYTWSLAEGSDSNVITNLSSDKNISFIGSYHFVDPANPGFEYIAEPDIQISAVLTSLEDLTVPLPPGDAGDAIVLLFSGTQESDITITVTEGTWYASAYYDDPADGGLAWHHANPYPAMYPQSIVFADLPFAAKSNIPVVLGSQDTTLPVELSSFIAVAMGIDGVKLSWATQSETNLLGFSVLRNTSSLFSEAISVSCMIPAANSSQLTQYSWQDMEIYTQDCYYYWLQIHELDGSLVSHGPVTVFAGHPADPELPDAPLQTRLLAPFPNPFNPSTTVHYELKTPDRVSFKIYNCKGQLVATHSQIHTNAGRYSWVFQGMDKQGQALASGVYLCVMNTREKTFVNKMVLAK